MPLSPEDLPEREKQVLRLLLVGHDAKSIGRALGHSTNIVNERLRDSRRKLGVGSSREAARLLASTEQASHNKFGNNPIGIAATETIREPVIHSGATLHGSRDNLFVVKGLIVTTISAILLAGAALYYGMSAAPAAQPTVVSTYPADGSAIPAGPYVLKVTYDRPMAAGSFSFVQASKESYPVCDAKPKQSSDQRSFSMACVAKPNGRYEIWFNRSRYMNFKSKDGLAPAVPKQLSFRTR